MLRWHPIVLMKRVMSVFSKYLLICGVIIVGGASAATLPVCQAGSLASYIALDATGGCTVGDYSFFRFTAPTPTVTGNPPLADLSQIQITPVVNSGSVGIQLAAASDGINLFSIPNPTEIESVTYHINYSVDPPVLGSGGISLDPPFGDVLATQRYCLSDVFANGCVLGPQVQQSVTPEHPFSEVSFPNPAVFVDITTDITMNASPGHPAGFDGLTSVLNVATAPVPEPSEVLLVAVGLCALAFVRTKRRRA
jgi:hypothetical protein